VYLLSSHLLPECLGPPVSPTTWWYPTFSAHRLCDEDNTHDVSREHTSQLRIERQRHQGHHRHPTTVRCVPDYPVSQSANDSHQRQRLVRNHRRTRGSTGLSGAPPDCPMRHKSVQCARQPKDATTNSMVGMAGMERNRTLFTAWCAPDSPVYPRTEGNQGLPNKEGMIVLVLGDIKGPPMCMELLPKYTKSTPKLWFNATTVLTHSRENWAFSWEKLCCFDSCVLSFACVCVVLLLFVLLFYSLITLVLWLRSFV
jgi:hypothetical protein